MIKIGKWEFSFRKEDSQWAYEDIKHAWEFIFRVERVTPYEAQHRADVKEMREKGLL